MQKNKERKQLTNDIGVEEALQLFRVEKEKCEELKKELTAIQSQLSGIQGFTDKQKSFHSLTLTKKPKMLFVILRYARVDLNTRLLTISFRNAFEVQVKKLQLSLYKHYGTEQGNLYDPRDMQEFAAKHSPGLWETLLKALTGDRGALTSERADLQKRRIVALLHILFLF